MDERIREISEKVRLLEETIGITISIREKASEKEKVTSNIVLGNLINEKNGLMREFEYLIRMKQNLNNTYGKNGGKICE